MDDTKRRAARALARRGRRVRLRASPRQEGEAGPIDLIGDIHGCLDTARALLASLGYESVDGRVHRHPEGRRALFLGDQALLGIPALKRLRNASELAGQVAVWPFESGLQVPDKPVVLAEVYPSLLKRAVDERADENELYDRAQMRVNTEAFASLNGRNALASLFVGSRALTADQRQVVETAEALILRLGHQRALLGALGSGKNAVREAAWARRMGSECPS